MESTSTSEIEFYLHGNKHSVKSSDVPPTTSLCDYLRNHMGLTGTKAMCREGGCGACVVAATLHHPVTGAEVTMAINSCLVSIFSCTGWKISTVEGLVQNKQYHPIQSAVQKENGTQCGFCTPGMIMNMYALQKEKKNNLTAEEIENSFGGNICRCTGYRPIVKAFRNFATAAEEDDFEMINDIEDVPCTEKCLPKCLEKCHIFDMPLFYESDSDLKWYRVINIKQIMAILMKFRTSIVRIVAGNTAKGVYRDMAEGDVCIDVNAVKELKSHVMNNNELILGGNVTLTEAMKIFSDAAKNNPNFKYLEKFTEHIHLVAHVPVRNIGTIAGNMMIKHTHREFPSDIFLLLESVGATVTISNLIQSMLKGFFHDHLLILVDTNYQIQVISMLKFLDYDMNKRLIKSVSLPALDSTHVFESYKIMCRAQNTHAMLNAAFLLKMDKGTVRKATITYGGVNPSFCHAGKTEKYLVNRNLFINTTLKNLFETLDSEVNPDNVLPDPKPEFRRKLASALLYKFILSIAPTLPPKFTTGGLKLVRGPSVSDQTYVEHPELFPVGKSINKLEALSQTSGEAEYIMDIPDFPGQLHGAFVLVKYPTGSQILTVNSDKAKKMKGVVDFVTETDIVGDNSYIPTGVYGAEDPIFCKKTVAYFNQPIGLILAKNREIAEKAAALVEIVAKLPGNNPVIEVKEAAKEKSRIKEMMHIKPAKVVPENYNVTGEVIFREQYHFHMETQCCIVVPKENEEYDMYPATQWMFLSHASAAACMKIPMNKINIKVRRLGGAYGGKISRNGLATCAAMIAAVKHRKPVKIWMTLEANMDALGKRNPIFGEYKAQVNDDGVIQSLKATINTGVGFNHSPAEFLYPMQEALIKSSYNFDTYDVTLNYIKTDSPANTFTRSPGSTEAHAFLETIMEHISYKTNLDPLQVRINNLNESHKLLKTFIDTTSTWAEVDSRKKEIEEFNKANRWRKRGMSVIPATYLLRFEGAYPVIVSIYSDGTVAISHGGIEMGQGINTKVAQVAAYKFGIPVEMVSVKPSNSLVSPSAYVSGGSITSESVCMALKYCCTNLLNAMGYTVSGQNVEEWKKAVGGAMGKHVKLTDTYSWNSIAPDDNYYIYGVCVTEVELDVLTGNHVIRRVDLLEDTGHSMSPFIDLGQVEGAFVMGLGYWSTEEIVYDDKGELKTNRTWTYKPPGMKDIPEKFYVKFPDNPNDRSPFKTKATAEPPLLLAFSLPLALRQALKSARADAGKKDLWMPIDGPSTVEQNFLNAINDSSQYTL